MSNAHTAWRKRVDGCEILKRAAIEDATKNIEAFFDLVYGEELEVLEAAAAEAQDALDTALEQEALSGIGAPYPVGTRLFKTTQKHSWEAPTTTYGVVDVMTRQSEFPSNESGWRRPQIGTFIVRQLVAGGERGKKYDTSFRDWKPVDPKVKRNETFFAPRTIKV